ncbi:MAG: response regulator transcription factor [Candidatus Marinimicrobia bacterium]|nr:response regulator transcription factor [Candidatus Neomarinimicrobiota bacterium]
MTSIFIVDDHALIREGIKRIILRTEDLEIVGEASDGVELMRALSTTQLVVDVLLLDISLPGRSGIDVLKQVKAIRPEIAVLILSIMSEEEYAIRALKAGASGFVKKETSPDVLVDAIRKVQRGGKYISPALADKLVDFMLNDDHGSLHSRLSDREFQVLVMIASGKTVSVIAKELSLSVKTISNFRSRALRKMGMTSNAQLMHYAMENNLI